MAARIKLNDIKPGIDVTWQRSLDKRLNSKPKGTNLPKVQLPPNGTPNQPTVVCKC